MKILKIVWAIAIFSFLASCSQPQVSDELSSVAVKATVKQTVDVFSPIMGTVNGSATLHRNGSGITVNYSTDGLIEGHAYTLWLAIWNKPQNCGTPGKCNEFDLAIADQVEVEVLYAGGHVVGKNGKGNFSARLNAGDSSASVNELFGLPPVGGLQVGNTFAAEVHAVIRSHGPAVPGMVSAQIGSYVGGCTDPFAIAPFTEIPDEVGECGDIEAAIFPPL